MSVRKLKALVIVASYLTGLNLAAASGQSFSASWIASPEVQEGRIAYPSGGRAQLLDSFGFASSDTVNGELGFVGLKMAATASSQELADIEAMFQNIAAASRRPPEPQTETRTSFTRLAHNCAFPQEDLDTVWWSGRMDNSFDPALGCNTHSNLDAMISNPRDLIAGRGTRYSDGDHAAAIVGQYRSGKAAAQAQAQAKAPAATTTTAAASKSTAGE